MKRKTLRWVLGTIIAIAIAAVPAAAKGQKKAKGGGTHSMTGCLQKGTEGNTYTLANVEGTGPKTVELVEMASGVNLAPHVGHKVTITGTTVNAKTAAKAEGTTGKKVEKKEERGEHHMKVAAVKMVSTTCP